MGFPGGSAVKNPLAGSTGVGLIPGLRNPLEEGMAIYSGILAWRIPFFIVQISHPYMTTGKTIALT